MRANPRMNPDAQQRRCAPLFRAGYAQRYVAYSGFSDSGIIKP